MDSSTNTMNDDIRAETVIRRLTSTGTRMTAEDKINDEELIELSKNSSSIGVRTRKQVFCKRYVPKKISNSDTDSDSEVEATDNLLGRLRRGINVIQTHARETMANCETDVTRADMQERLETSTIKMIRAEKSFMNTSRIIAEVVDEFASDFEEDNVKSKKVENAEQLQQQDGHKQETVVDGENKDEQKINDDDDVITPIYRSTIFAAESSMRDFTTKLSGIMDEKMSAYENTLTDDILRKEKKFKEVERQIIYGRKDAENSERPLDLLPGGGGDMDDLYDAADDLSSLSDYDSSEEQGYDEFLLPSTDPITLGPIYTAVRNKHCNHVFDKISITNFMKQNPKAKCPMIDCRNGVELRMEDLILEEKLTDQIRRKNKHLYEKVSRKGFWEKI